ncbi:MAG: TPM domain-containing protein [Candidatus Accumulibacter sp.]|jgi:uncharacterized protein|nr:TPM domain-containing protein [Accumulibacter sp.]
MTVRFLIVFFLTAALSAVAVASDEQKKEAFPIPDRYTLVNDYTGVLLFSTAVRITEKLQTLERQNGTQIVILIVPSVGDGGVMEYAENVLDKWDIGNNGQGNGVLFLVSNEGWAIRTGPGIAGALPDAKVARIFREIVEPYWKREEYSEGIEAGVDAMIEAVKGEDTAPTFYDYRHPYVPTRIENVLIAVLAAFGVIYAGVLLRRRVRQNRGGK